MATREPNTSIKVWNNVYNIILLLYEKVREKERCEEVEKTAYVITYNFCKDRRFTVNIFSAFGFLMVNIQLFSASGNSQPERISTVSSLLFRSSENTVPSSTGERGDIFLLRGGLDACSHAQALKLLLDTSSSDRPLKYACKLKTSFVSCASKIPAKCIELWHQLSEG